MEKRSTENKKRIILGVTGSFGSGKTTVSRILSSLFKAKIIDADKIAHDLLLSGGGVYKKIVCVFGSNLIKKDREIDRKQLARKVFSDSALIKKLNGITHPRILKAIKTRIHNLRGNNVIIDAPLLFETGLNKYVDKVIVVKLNRINQIKRLRRRLPLITKADISRRLRFQMPLKEKIILADFIIDNNGTLNCTKKQVESIRRKLWKN